MEFEWVGITGHQGGWMQIGGVVVAMRVNKPLLQLTTSNPLLVCSTEIQFTWKATTAMGQGGSGVNV